MNLNNSFSVGCVRDHRDPAALARRVDRLGCAAAQGEESGEFSQFLPSELVPLESPVSR